MDSANSKIWHIIVNPAAGNGKAADNWKHIQSLLDKAGISYQSIFTERAGHATELCKTAIENGARKIVTVGGDGTHNEVMNGIFQQQVVSSTDITLGLIPIGTGNDWIKTHGIPNDFEKTIMLLKKEKTTLQDVGLASYYKDGKQGQRYFMNVAGLAYDGYVGKMISENRSLIGNQLSYLWLIFRCLFQYKLRKARVIYDGEHYDSKFYTINIGICRYSGGGMQFVPHAIPDDGLFALTFARKISKLEVVLATPFLYNGMVEKLYFATTKQVKSVKVEALDELPTHLEIDGEYVGHTPVEITMVEKGLRVIANE